MGFLPERSEVVVRHILERQAKKLPEKQCLLFDESDETWTYRNTLNVAYGAANALAAMGIGGMAFAMYLFEGLASSATGGFFCLIGLTVVVLVSFQYLKDQPTRGTWRLTPESIARTSPRQNALRLDWQQVQRVAWESERIVLEGAGAKEQIQLSAFYFSEKDWRTLRSYVKQVLAEDFDFSDRLPSLAGTSSTLLRMFFLVQILVLMLTYVVVAMLFWMVVEFGSRILGPFGGFVLFGLFWLYALSLAGVDYRQRRRRERLEGRWRDRHPTSGMAAKEGTSC